MSVLVIGALALPHLRDETLRWVIVGFIMVFLLNQLTSKALVISEPRGQTLAPWVGSVTGFFQGATGLSGPIVIPWFMSLGLRRDTYIFAVSAVFGLTGLLQIVVFAGPGSVHRRAGLARRRPSSRWHSWSFRSGR